LGKREEKKGGSCILGGKLREGYAARLELYEKKLGRVRGSPGNPKELGRKGKKRIRNYGVGGRFNIFEWGPKKKVPKTNEGKKKKMTKGDERNLSTFLGGVFCPKGGGTCSLPGVRGVEEGEKEKSFFPCGAKIKKKLTGEEAKKKHRFKGKKKRMITKPGQKKKRKIGWQKNEKKDWPCDEQEIFSERRKRVSREKARKRHERDRPEKWPSLAEGGDFSSRNKEKGNFRPGRQCPEQRTGELDN